MSDIALWIQRLVNFGSAHFPLPGLPLQGESLIVRNFQRSDEEKRQQWAKFNDPYLRKYNFNPRGTLENDRTFQKLQDRIRLAVDTLQGEMVGYISLKPVKNDPFAADIGICFDADYVSKGLGREALSIALPWAVKTLNLKRIILEVDAVNQRAVELYRSFGFYVIKERWQKEDNPVLTEIMEKNNISRYIRKRKNQIEILARRMEWISE